MNKTATFRNILHAGPNYVRHKGGMGAVIETYEKHVADFNFIASYEGNYNSIVNVPFFAVSLIKIFWELSANKDIKIVHLHGASFGSFYRKYLLFLVAKYLFGKQVVYHLHAAEFHTFYEETNGFAKNFIKHLINGSSCVIVLSRSWEDFIRQHFSPKRILILPNPVEIPVIEEGHDSGASSAISFLFLGRIGDRKGLFDLLEVVSENREYYKDQISLTIGGDGEVEKLKAYIKDHQLHHIVKYIGWVDGELKHRLLSECDALILPSYNEGLPISILEAMSYGKAIVSTNVGGIPEVVKEGINGYLINPGDKTALADKIGRFIEDRYSLDFMGQESIKIVAKYDILEVLKQMQSLYDSLLGRPIENESSKYHFS